MASFLLKRTTDSIAYGTKVKNGRYVVGAYVVLYNSTTSTLIGQTQTDKYGRWYIIINTSTPDPGIYQVRFYGSGLISAEPPDGDWEFVEIVDTTAAQQGAVTYRGIWKVGTQYYGSAIYHEAVKAPDGKYYYSIADSLGVQPPNAGSWTYFSDQFASVATDLLLAQDVAVGRTITLGTALEDGGAGGILQTAGVTGLRSGTGGFYVKGSGLSELRIGTVDGANLVSGLLWDGPNNIFEIRSKNFSIDQYGNVTITGLITATSGLIGGWTIGPTSLYSNSGAGVGMSSGDWPFYAGDTNPANAEFRVSNAGALYASNATISGSISASSGVIGGWIIGPTYLYSTNVGLAPYDYPVFAGADYSSRASAPFRVNTAGSIYSISGIIGGWALDTNTLTALTNGQIRTGSSGTYITLDRNYLQSSTYISGNQGFRITSSTADAEFNNIVARGTFRASVFAIDEVNATGGTMMVTDAAEVVSGLTTPNDLSTTWYLCARKTYTNQAAMFGGPGTATGYVIRLKFADQAVNGVTDIWATRTSAAAVDGGTYWRFTVQNATVNSQNKNIYKGTAAVGYGTSTSKKIILTSDLGGSAVTPYIDMFTTGSSPWNGVTTNLRLGNLTGITDPSYGTLPSGTYGLYADNAYLKGAIVAASGLIGGWNIGSNYLYSTAGNGEGLAPLDYPFFAGAQYASRASAPFRVNTTGAIYSVSGIIGGWNLTPSQIFARSLVGSGMVSMYGFQASSDWWYGGFELKDWATWRTGNKARYHGFFGMSDNGSPPTKPEIVFYVGATTNTSPRSDAAFYIDMDGGMRFGGTQTQPGMTWDPNTNELTLSGIITATQGKIGGWNIGATSLYAGTGSSTVGLASSGGYAIYAGSATPSAAPFRVDPAGNVWATAGFIGGDDSSTGWEITTGSIATTLNGGEMFLSTVNLERAYASILGIDNYFAGLWTYYTGPIIPGSHEAYSSVNASTTSNVPVIFAGADTKYPVIGTSSIPFYVDAYGNFYTKITEYLQTAYETTSISGLTLSPTTPKNMRIESLIPRSFNESGSGGGLVYESSTGEYKSFTYTSASVTWGGFDFIYTLLNCTSDVGNIVVPVGGRIFARRSVTTINDGGAFSLSTYGPRGVYIGGTNGSSIPLLRVEQYDSDAGTDYQSRAVEIYHYSKFHGSTQPHYAQWIIGGGYGSYRGLSVYADSTGWTPTASGQDTIRGVEADTYAETTAGSNYALAGVAQGGIVAVGIYASATGGGSLGSYAGIFANAPTRFDKQLQIAEISSPTTPGTGYGYLYAKSDNLIYWKSDAGIEYDLTGASSASGITSINTLTSTAQTLVVGTAGTGFNIVSTGSTHTFNLPFAGISTSGIVSTGVQTFSGQKTFNNNVHINGNLVFDGTYTIYPQDATVANDLTIMGGVGSGSGASGGILYLMGGEGNGIGDTGIVSMAYNGTSLGGVVIGSNVLTAGYLLDVYGDIRGYNINAITALKLNGADINTAGTLSNVAYLNQANRFTARQGIFSVAPQLVVSGLTNSEIEVRSTSGGPASISFYNGTDFWQFGHATTVGHYLFQYNSSTKMSINSAGQMTINRIGTPTPLATLDVNGNAYIATGLDVPEGPVHIGAAVGAFTASGITFDKANQSQLVNVWGIDAANSTTSNPGYWGIYSVDANGNASQSYDIRATHDIAIKYDTDNTHSGTFKVWRGNTLGGGTGVFTLDATGQATLVSGLTLGTYLQLPEISAPTTPSSGFGLLYAKSDSKLWFKSDTGQEYNLTASGVTGPAGSNSYVQYNDNGIFGGTSNFEWVNASNSLLITGSMQISKATSGTIWALNSFTNGLGRVLELENSYATVAIEGGPRQYFRATLTGEGGNESFDLSAIAGIVENGDAFDTYQGALAFYYFGGEGTAVTEGARLGSDGMFNMWKNASVSGLIRIKEINAPTTPPSTYGYLYAGTDSKLYWANDLGTTYDLTASGTSGGGISSVGSPAATQVAYWASSTALSGHIGFTYLPGTSALSVSGLIALGSIPSSTGILRIPNNNSIGWRNAANSGDYTLALNSSNLFAFSNSLTVTGGTTISTTHTVTQSTITGNTPAFDGSATWNNSAVTFRGIEFAITTGGAGYQTTSTLLRLRTDSGDRFYVQANGATLIGLAGSDLTINNSTVYATGATVYTGDNLHVGVSDGQAGITFHGASSANKWGFYKLTSTYDFVLYNYTSTRNVLRFAEAAGNLTTLYANMVIEGTTGFNANGETAQLSIGDTNHYAKAVYGSGLAYVTATNEDFTYFAGSTFIYRLGGTGLLTIKELTAPTTTALSGYGYLYANTADGKLYWKDDAGTVYDLTLGSSLPADNITGLGASNRVAYFTGNYTISGNNNFTYNGSTISVSGLLDYNYTTADTHWNLGTRALTLHGTGGADVGYTQIAMYGDSTGERPGFVMGRLGPEFYINVVNTTNRVFSNSFAGLTTMISVSGLALGTQSGNADLMVFGQKVGINRTPTAYALEVDGDINLEAGHILRYAGTDAFAGYTPTSRTLTLTPGAGIGIAPGGAQDLSANRSWTVTVSGTIGATATWNGQVISSTYLDANIAYKNASANITADWIFDGSTYQGITVGGESENGVVRFKTVGSYGTLTSLDLASDYTWYLPNASGVIALTKDLNAYSPATRTLTLVPGGGVGITPGGAQDLSANRSWTLTASGITVLQGGTGATTLTGWVYGNGSSAMTATTTPTFGAGSTWNGNAISSTYLDANIAYKNAANTFSLSQTISADLIFSGANRTIYSLDAATASALYIRAGSSSTSGGAGANLFVCGGPGNGAGTDGNVLLAWDGGSIGAVAIGQGTVTATYLLDVAGSIRSSSSINAVTSFLLNGASLNTGGTLSNVAYKDATNLFTGAMNGFSQTVSVSGLLDYNYTAADTRWNLGTRAVVIIGTGGSDVGYNQLQLLGGSTGERPGLSIGRAVGELGISIANQTNRIFLNSAAGIATFFDTTGILLGTQSGNADLAIVGQKVGINKTPVTYALEVDGDVDLDSTHVYRLAGADINTAGTLTNVAYENQANTFTQNNLFNGTVNTFSSNVVVSGTLTARATKNYFGTANSTISVNGMSVYGSGNTRVVVEATSGNAEINLVQSTNTWAIYTGAGSLFFYNGGNRVEIDTSGNAIFAGDVTANGSPSDMVLKMNIKDMKPALDKILSMRPVEFDWNPEKIERRKGHDVGLIAQEVEKIAPELVTTGQDGIKRIHYDKAIPLLIAAIKELKDRLDNVGRAE
jgi:hypothetical protein